MTELKPCPFCGGEVRPLYIMAAWSVACSCGAGIDEFESEAEAIAAWNTRTPAPALLALVGELVGALEVFTEGDVDVSNTAVIIGDGAAAKIMQARATLTRAKEQQP